MIKETNLSLSLKKLKIYSEVKLKDDKISKELFNKSIMKMCLRATDYNYENAFQLGINYFQRLNKKIEFESKESLYKFLNNSVVKVFCNKGSNGETILMISLSNWDPIIYESELIPCSIALILDYLIRFENIQLNGFIILINLNNLKLKQWTKLKKKLILKILDSFENSAPIKISKIIILSKNNFGILVSKTIKKNMKEKLREKLLIMSKSNYEEIYNLFNSSSFSSYKLPEEMDCLCLSNLIDHTLDYMPGYYFGNKTAYCSLLNSREN